MKIKTLSILSSTALLLSVSSAFAGTEVGEWYVGGSLGVTDNNTNDNDIFYNPDLCLTAAYTCSADSSDTAASIFAGYQITNHFAVELAYTDLGDTANYNYQQPFSTGTLKQDTQALSLTGIGKHRLGHSKVSAFGKLGISNWHSEIKYDRTPDSAIFTDRSVKSSGTDPLLGVGLEFDVSHNAAIRVGWDRHYNVGESAQPFDVGNNTIKTVDTDVDVLYVGAAFSF